MSIRADAVNTVDTINSISTHIAIYMNQLKLFEAGETGHSQYAVDDNIQDLRSKLITLRKVRSDLEKVFYGTF